MTKGIRLVICMISNLLLSSCYFVFSSSSSRTRQSIPIHFYFLSATFHISGVRDVNKTKY